MKLSMRELPSEVGTQSESSEWIVVDQKLISQFAELSGDAQWIHVDAQRARAEGMAGTIAHGLLVLSLIGGRFVDCFQVEGAARTINAGFDKVRFLQPVAVDSEIRVWLEVATVTPRDDGYRVTYRARVELRGSESPAAIAELVLLHLV